MHDATRLRPLPYLSTDAWWLWDCKETGNVFIVKVEGYLPALFNVKDVDRFLDFFGGRRDTTLICVERSATMWNVARDGERRTDRENHFFVEREQISLRATLPDA